MSHFFIDVTDVVGEMMYWTEWAGQKFAFVTSTYAKANFPGTVAKFLEDRLLFQ